MALTQDIEYAKSQSQSGAIVADWPLEVPSVPSTAEVVDALVALGLVVRAE